MQKCNDPVVKKQLSKYLEVIKSTEMVWGKSHRRLLPALDRMAELYLVLGRYADAESTYWRYLRILEKAFSDKTPNFGHTLQRLGETFEAQGLLGECERFYLWSLEDRLQNPCPFAELVESYASLINLYRQTTEHAKASLMEEELNICLQVENNRKHSTRLDAA